jgi:hypothetical protein
VCVHLLASQSLFSAREIDICMAIKPSLNVVTLYGICADAPDHKLRIVMERCAHGCLRDYVKRLPTAEVTCQHCRQSCRCFSLALN